MENRDFETEGIVERKVKSKSKKYLFVDKAKPKKDKHRRNKTNILHDYLSGKDVDEDDTY